MPAREYVLTLSFPDTTGIVFRVSGFLFERGCNIIDSQQFGDGTTGQFFMRVHFALADGLSDEQVRNDFQAIAAPLGMRWELHDLQRKARVMLMVSKFGHCLNDLLFRVKSGQLPVDVRAVVSNHPDFALLAASHGIPFYHLPVKADAKAEQERQVLQIVEQERIDLVVLARTVRVVLLGKGAY